MSFGTYVQTTATAFLLLTCGYTVWRGGGAERFVAMLVFLSWCITPLLQNNDAFHKTQIGVFFLDAGLALVLFAVAVTSDRIWPIWATAFQILELLMHAAMLIDHGVRPRAYWIGMEIWSYLVLISMAVGTWRRSSRLKNAMAGNVEITAP